MTSLTTKRRKPGSYEREDIEKVLTVLFNGGVQWRDESAPEADMPKSTGNPSHGGNFLAEKVDVERAWFAAFDRMRSPEALYLYYGNGMKQAAIGTLLKTPQQTVSDHLFHDVGVLMDAATAGERPTGFAAIRYRTIRGIK